MDRDIHSSQPTFSSIHEPALQCRGFAYFLDTSHHRTEPITVFAPVINVEATLKFGIQIPPSPTDC
jgi:hypothetical protein